MKHQSKKLILLTYIAFIPNLYSSELVIPNKFSAGTPAVAAEVNENFNQTVLSVNDIDQRLQVLEAIITAQQLTIDDLIADANERDNTINSLEQNSVIALDGILTLEQVNYEGITYPTVKLSGVNLQVVDGSGTTNNPFGLPQTGLGNFIIGYNQANLSARLFCSDSSYFNESDCQNNNYIGEQNQRTGSHNFILGDAHSYTSHGGIVAGFRNIVSSPYSSVTGGQDNLARGDATTVAGGLLNESNNDAAVVLGGLQNVTNGNYSVIVGGFNNTTFGDRSVVSGGSDRTAVGNNNWVAGSLVENN